MTEEKREWDNSEHEKFERESEITIFDPRGIHVDKYKQKYPELNRYIEFQNVTNIQLRFAWWFSNPTSPLVINDNNGMRRAARAYQKVWGNTANDTKNRDALCSLRFADNLKVAVEKMATFDVGTRERANSMVERMFANCEKISKLNPDDFVDDKKQVDYVKFLSANSMSLKMLPELLRVKEEGFAIKEKKGKLIEEDDGQMNITEFLNNKKDE